MARTPLPPVIDSPEKRIFPARRDNGDIVMLVVRKASRREIEAGDLEYSAMVNRALWAGLMPRVKLYRKLIENKSWSEAEETDMENKRLLAVGAEDRLAKAKERGDPADEIASIKADRDKKIAAYQERYNELNSMLRHSTDSKADLVRRNFMICCTVEYADTPTNGALRGNRVWENVDKFMDESDGSLADRAMYEFQSFNSRLPSEWEEVPDAPEPIEAATPSQTPVTTAAVAAPPAPVEAVAVTTQTQPPLVPPGDTSPNSNAAEEVDSDESDSDDSTG